MHLIPGKPTFKYPLLYVAFTDRDTGTTYPVTMDEEGTFTHDHGLKLETAREDWEDRDKLPNGKPRHEDWKDQLIERNRQAR